MTEKKYQRETDFVVENTKKKTDSVPVTIIAHHSDASLVQWVDKGGLRRVYVPDTVITGGRVTQDELDAGVEYGIPWDTLMNRNILVEASKIGAELRNNGIWTLEDLHAKSGVLNSILLGLLEGLYKEIVTKAENFRSQEIK
jgi:hypothetical protein